MAQQTRSHWDSGAMNFYDASLDTTWKTGVWADCPLLAIAANPQVGYTFFEDFTNYQGTIANADPPTMTGWTAIQSNTTGGLAILDTVGGILEIDSEGAAQHDQLLLRHGGAALNLGEHYKCAASKDLWFECRFRSRDHTADVDMFVGLAEQDDDLMASGDMAEADSDYIGLCIETTAAPAAKVYACKDGTEASDTGVTVTDATWFRFGFKVSGVSGIEYWIDGSPVTLTNITSTVIPTNEMMITFISGTDASSDPILDIDWVKVAQLR